MGVVLVPVLIVGILLARVHLMLQLRGVGREPDQLDSDDPIARVEGRRYRCGVQCHRRFAAWPFGWIWVSAEQVQIRCVGLVALDRSRITVARAKGLLLFHLLFIQAPGEEGCPMAIWIPRWSSGLRALEAAGLLEA